MYRDINTPEQWQERRTWLHTLGITDEMMRKYRIDWEYYRTVTELVWLVRARDVIRNSALIRQGRQSAKIDRRNGHGPNADR